MTTRYYQLKPIWGGSTTVTYVVGPDPQIIGRAEAADIILREDTVSREHATVCSNGGGVHLQDMDSKHGTFVNGRRVAAATLVPGDLLVLGLATVLRIERVRPYVIEAPVVPDDITMPGGRRSISSRQFAAALFGQGSAGGGDRTVTPPGGVETLYLDLLPSVYARLTKLLDTMRRLSDKGARRVDPAPVVELLEPVLATVARLLELTTEASDGALTAFPLREVVDLAAAEVGSTLTSRQLRILIDLSAELQVSADRCRLVAAIAGLLEVAGQASMDGGLIEVVGRRRDEQQVELLIIDHGTGLPEEVMVQAYHHLDRELPDAALRIWEARKVVLTGGGTFMIKSQGSGTMVVITLPAAGAPGLGA